MNEIKNAITYFEDAVRESDEIISDCSPDLQTDLAAQKEHFVVALKALQAQLDREKQPDGWIEIEETPPGDIGLWVWAYSVDGEVMLAKYVGERLYHADNGMTYWGEYFTHWMPANIPQPPKEEKA